MTLDMAFECLLVSRDPAILCPLNNVLDRLSISTRVCLTPSRAVDELMGGSTDLVVIDWQKDGSAEELINHIQKFDFVRKKTIVLVSSDGAPVRGAHMILKKPLTPQSSEQGLKMVYHRMLKDYRRSTRHAVMTSVLATNSKNQLVPVTVTNIGDGGLGISSKEALTIGEVLSLHLALPGARRAIYVEARILWTRNYGVCGLEFVRIPPVDLDILHDWLNAKCQVKKPLLML